MSVRKPDEQTGGLLGFERMVPLCVHEVTSRQAQAQLRKSMPVVWWGTPAEVHSAISRLHRLGKVKDVEKRGALSRLTLLSRGWREILPGDPEIGRAHV